MRTGVRDKGKKKKGSSFVVELPFAFPCKGGGDYINTTT